MSKKEKSPTAIELKSTRELVAEISKLNRILAHSKEDFRLGDKIIQIHKITGELCKRNRRVK